MKTFQKKAVAVLVAALLAVTVTVAPALAAEDAPTRSADAMVADAIFLRPMGLVATCFGGAVFVLSLPFSIVGGNTSEVGEKLVGDPLRYTFKRPLGQID